MTDVSNVPAEPSPLVDEKGNPVVHSETTDEQGWPVINNPHAAVNEPSATSTPVVNDQHEDRFGRLEAAVKALEVRAQALEARFL